MTCVSMKLLQHNVAVRVVFWLLVEFASQEVTLTKKLKTETKRNQIVKNISLSS